MEKNTEVKNTKVKVEKNRIVVKDTNNIFEMFGIDIPENGKDFECDDEFTRLVVQTALISVYLSNEEILTLHAIVGIINCLIDKSVVDITTFIDYMLKLSFEEMEELNTTIILLGNMSRNIKNKELEKASTEK